MLALALLLSTALAHPAPPSLVRLDVDGPAVALNLELPREQLAMAMSGTPHGDAPLPEDEAILRYALDHLRVEADGAPLTELVTAAGWVEAEGHDSYTIALRLPLDAPLTTLTLHDDAIAHTVASHRITVLRGGEVLGVLRRGHTSLDLEAPTGGTRGAVLAAAAAGLAALAGLLRLSRPLDSPRLLYRPLG